MSDYAFTVELSAGFETAADEVQTRLKNEGFGVLSTINVREKFKEKLGVDFKKYVILGACNPKMAHCAIEAEERIGLMLPCNVIVYEKADKTVVAAIRPTVAMQMIDNPELQSIAEQVERALRKVIESLAPAQVLP
jgi:uncharacterized protein (DUF302 family)